MKDSDRPDSTAAIQRARIQQLEQQVRQLHKTNEVLLNRVENRINVEGGAFAAFQVASNLEKTVADRTTELRQLNERMEHELYLRRSFQTALVKAKTEAEAATASRTRFVAAASHDLRQPLNAAVLYLESISQEGLRESDAEGLRGISLALENLDGLLATLLDISRLDSGGLQPNPSDFYVQPLFDRLANEYSAIARTRHLELKAMPTRAVVHSDLMLLETILRNLLSNAIKYTDTGRILMGLRRRGDRVSIEVRDTGVGVSKEHILRIFDEFWRAPGSTDSGTHSTGLGLSIVERVCQLLGTNIQVYSKPGKGSTFMLELPRGEASLVKERTGAPLIPSETSFNQQLMVVIDDNRQVLRSMERMLLSWGCRVLAASGIEEAISAIIDGDLTPQLLLTDYHLAGDAKGIDAINTINAELETSAPAIMISSDNSLLLQEKLEKLDIPLLTKPVEPARLRAVMLHRLLGRKS
ncbi:MAG: signal transduction histidine kinase/CheY-like chemotaxis protein [Halieaceae bacterium]|jgi:signal transduction histidine kinase/CheY-like chemotaxis protein